MTIPNKYSRVLGIHWQDYVEIYLADKDTLVVRKHKVLKQKGGEYGTSEYTITAAA